MWRTRLEKFWERLGPGIITGVSDDDPSGIATYSQAGAQLGTGALWTTIFTLPFMAAIQEVSARIGRVSGRGIAGNLRHRYPPAVMHAVVFILLMVNTINLGADIQAVGAAVNLMVGGPIIIYSALFALGALVLEIFVPYMTYVRWLKWLTWVLGVYILAAFTLNVSWSETAKAALTPNIHFSRDFFKIFLAILGTTISPYLFFWQASQEVEELRDHHKKPLRHDAVSASRQFARIRLDTGIGMFFSNLVAFFIMLTAAVTLNTHGIQTINTAADAAEALRPLAGEFCFLLFSVGIIGSGMMAVPVLAGSAAYAVSEAMGWRTGLQKKPHQAKGFYTIIGLSTVIGLSLTLLNINPMQALVWTAVLNGVIASPVMFLMMRMSSDQKVMGEFALPPTLRIFGWLAMAVMAFATAGLFIVGP